mmetsp:Transcript_107292/g.269012  ORF Transcript_107292/g.269012 Transcript_107292/m.269012 type:complete len:205 (-) Transcript_107292:1471-2085(-)
MDVCSPHELPSCAATSLDHACPRSTHSRAACTDDDETPCYAARLSDRFEEQEEEASESPEDIRDGALVDRDARLGDLLINFILLPAGVSNKGARRRFFGVGGVGGTSFSTADALAEVLVVSTSRRTMGAAFSTANCCQPPKSSYLVKRPSASSSASTTSPLVLLRKYTIPRCIRALECSTCTVKREDALATLVAEITPSLPTER